MDRDIKVVIKDKVATAVEDPVIICGNSDYTITFAFDDEWAGIEVKTALFKWLTADGAKKHEQPFTGDVVEVPVLADTREVEVGVYAGDLTTTTGAPIRCLPSIRCGSGEKVEPSPDKYDQLMELIKKVLAGGAGLTEEQAADLAANTEARHAHDNKEVLDGFGENYASTLPTYKGKHSNKAVTLIDLDGVVSRDNALRVEFDNKLEGYVKKGETPEGGGGAAPEMLEAVFDYTEAYIHTETGNVLTFECSLLPNNARVCRLELPDVVNETEEYIPLEDMVAKDPVGLSAPYFIHYPKNMQGSMFTVAAAVVFPLSPNTFYEAAGQFLFMDKTLKIYYTLEE